MMYRKLLIVLMCFLQVAAFAGKPKAPKEPKKPKQIWYKPVTKEANDVNIKASNAFSEKDLMKFKFDIENTSNNYMVFKPTETAIKTPTGDIAPNDKKKIVIKPLDKESRVIDALSTSDKSLYEYNLKYSIDGLYKVQTGEALKMPDYETPIVKRFIEIGDFKIEQLTYSFYPVGFTYGTRVRFKVTYIGNGVAIIDPRRISGITRDNQNVPCNTDEKPFLLFKGESENINIKILSPVQANIMWNDSFNAATLVKQDNITLDFEQDKDKK